ncbi:MAG: serine/threonine protein kinase [Myxococcaceae bacterium]|nr:serine/threonine protein kinase [Myxococcaceae bacterium]
MLLLQQQVSLGATGNDTLSSQHSIDGAFGFTVVRALGHSALADVLLVESPSGVRQVWKVLTEEAAAEATTLGRFMDEALLRHRLAHHHIVRGLGSGRLPNGRLYQATELLEGLALDEQLALHGPLFPEQAVPLFSKICEAVRYLHEQGTVHRDLRPGNVFLHHGLIAQNPKLLGLGMAYFRGGKTVDTTAGTLLSRPEYCAPECIAGHAADARADVYALGVMLFEALSGQAPFTGADFGHVLKAHVEEPVPELPASAGHLVPIVNRCLAKRPQDRFAHAGELLEALAQFGELPSVLAPTLDVQHVAYATPWVRQAMEGDVVGNYELLRLLGDGGMARVFLARHVRLGRHVAIKLLKPEQSQQKTLVERFFHEAQAVNHINHEHIVDIYDFVDETLADQSRRSYYVMEALDGQTLHQAIGGGGVSVGRGVRIMRQVCLALQAAHDVGVVHRDIKPDNIFLTHRSGDVFAKVLDFGVAKLLPLPGLEPMSKTLAGVIIGTPTYMSPEQANGHEIDSRSDIYSVGVVLYELLTGQPPFDAQAFMQLAMQISTELPAPLGNYTPTREPIPPGLKSIVLRCLEKDPHRRYATMNALRLALAPYDDDGFEYNAGRPVTHERGVSIRMAMGASAAAAAALATAVGWLMLVAPRYTVGQQRLVVTPATATQAAALPSSVLPSEAAPVEKHESVAGADTEPALMVRVHEPLLPRGWVAAAPVAEEKARPPRARVVPKPAEKELQRDDLIDAFGQ